jgi:2-oxoglutarate dehydrogenase E2 component (dihydrolipoamide succinyltransferase)
MAKFELKLPKMGESVAEATITSWLKEVGDTIEMDEPVLEVATDKVDSEVPSEVDGVIAEILFDVDDVISVGQTIAIIETDANVDIAAPSIKSDSVVAETIEQNISEIKNNINPVQDFSSSDNFYSPLVKNIAKEEGISLAELETIEGTGKDGRVTKNDMLSYVKNRGNQENTKVTQVKQPEVVKTKKVSKPVGSSLTLQEGDEVVAMSRMRKLISGYMVNSLETSAHVQSFLECDVTNIWKWRAKVKDAFQKREGEKLTFTPIFMEAVAYALKKYPGMNVSVDGDNIIQRKHINIGMAAALPDGNLIVPVIKNADQLNLVGMAKAVNSLAVNARAGKLNPDDIKGGTYTVTNVGTFGSIMGTPIINQPEVGILALGAIRKTPSVIETPDGDFIGVRMKMYLSHSYDHRVVDGALGGMFAKCVADYLEAWDINRDF